MSKWSPGLHDYSCHVKCRCELATAAVEITSFPTLISASLEKKIEEHYQSQ